MGNQKLEELLAKAKQLTEKQKELLRKTNKIFRDLGQPEIQISDGSEEREEK